MTKTLAITKIRDYVYLMAVAKSGTILIIFFWGLFQKMNRIKDSRFNPEIYIKYQIHFSNVAKYISNYISLSVYRQNNMKALTKFGQRTQNSFRVLIYKHVLWSPLKIFHNPDSPLNCEILKTSKQILNSAGPDF